MTTTPLHMQQKVARRPSAGRAAAIVRWVSLAFLTLSVVALLAAQSYMTRKQGEMAGAQREVIAAKQEKAQREAQAARAVALSSLLKEATGSGLSFTDWSERRFNMRQAVMSREEAGKLVAELRHTERAMFAAEQFDISVKDVSQGLFTPSAANAELLVTLRGSMIFARQN